MNAEGSIVVSATAIMLLRVEHRERAAFAVCGSFLWKV